MYTFKFSYVANKFVTKTLVTHMVNVSLYFNWEILGFGNFLLQVCNVEANCPKITPVQNH